jgi:hypothetical protein
MKRPPYDSAKLKLFIKVWNFLNGQCYQITALVVWMGNSIADWGLTKARSGFILQGYFEYLLLEHGR